MRKGDHYIRMLDAQLVICDETQLFLHDRDPGDNLLVGWAYEVGILVDARKLLLYVPPGLITTVMRCLIRSGKMSSSKFQDGSPRCRRSSQSARHLA